MCCKFNFSLSELALSQFQSNIVVLVFPVQTFVGLDDVTKLQYVNFLHADSTYFSLFLCFHGTHLDFFYAYPCIRFLETHFLTMLLLSLKCFSLYWHPLEDHSAKSSVIHLLCYYISDSLFQDVAEIAE